MLGVHRTRYARRSVLVVGSGHSAFNVLLDLSELSASAPGTAITWAVRRGDVGEMYGGGAADALPARGELGARLRALVDRGRVRLVTGFRTAQVRRQGAGVVVVDAGQVTIGPVDEINFLGAEQPEVESQDSA